MYLKEKSLWGKEMRNKRSTGIALSYIYLVLNMVIGIFLSSFIIRKLGDIEYGLYQTIGAFANYLMLLEFGTGTVMTRNISIYKNEGEDELVQKCISTMWIITIVLSLIVLAIGSIFVLNMDFIYQLTMTSEQIQYGKRLFILIVINLVLSFYQSTANGMLLGFENYTFANKLKLIKLVFRTFIAVSVIVVWPMAIALTIVDCLMSIGCLLWTYKYSRKNYYFRISIKLYDVKILKESLPLCLALLLQTIINQANNEVDKTILGVCMSLESVSIYSVAQYFYLAFSSIATVPISIYLPEVAKGIIKGVEGQELTKTLIQPCRLVVICAGMIMFGFIAVGRQFITILYGSKYIHSWLYAILIMIPMFINLTNGILVNVLDVLRKRMIRSYVLLGTTILNICLTIYLIKIYGIIGAVISTAIAVIIGQDIIMNLYYSKITGIHIIYLFRKAYAGLLPTEIIACIISLLLANLIDNDWISLIMGGSIFFILCLLGFNYFGFNDIEKEKEKELIGKLFCKQ